MVTVYTSNGRTYTFPKATRYRFGDKTVKIYEGQAKIANFTVEKMDCVVLEEDCVSVGKRNNGVNR